MFKAWQITTNVAKENLLATSFKDLLAEEQILSSDCDLKLYEADATALYKKKPSLVLLPNNTKEVQAVVKRINELNADEDSKLSKVVFTPRGAGTGLSGGAIAADNSVVISTARLNELHTLNPDGEYAVVGSGFVNKTLSTHAGHHGLYFAPDPSSQAACTIGGNVAENAGGIHCFKYGVTADHLLGLEIVLPDGEIAYLGNLGADDSYKPNADQIDFTGMIAGTEGTFGLVTKAMVRLSQVPEYFISAQVAFEDTNESARFIARIIKEGFEPAALEAVDNNTIKAINKAFNLGFPDSVVSVVLVEFDGLKSIVKHDFDHFETLAKAYKIYSFKHTDDLAERNKLWKIRKGAAAAFGQLAPYWYLYDCVVPRSKIPDALKRIEVIAEKHNLMLANILHAGDGNLHPNFLYDPDTDSGVIDRIHRASKEIMTMCIDLGGTLSGEHGIGIEKREYLSYLFTDEDMQLMLELRSLFDTEFIANPDKLFPVRICRECFGEVHNHD